MENRELRTQSNWNTSIKDSNFSQLFKLQQNVAHIMQRNRRKYNQILSEDAGYSIILYQPNDKLKAEKAFRKELLLKQVDRLMDQESLFDKKLTQLKFIREVELQQQEKMLERELNPYQALRTAWVRHQKTTFQVKTSADRLESLNFTIGMIRSTVMGMKAKQEQHVFPHLLNISQPNNQKYQKLLTSYQRSMMANQQLRQEINSLYLKLQHKQQNEQKLNQKLAEKQKQNKSLKKTKEILQIEHKFSTAQLKQQIHSVQKKLEKLEKWKFSIKKHQIENKVSGFRLYVDLDDSMRSQEGCLQLPKATSKILFQIEAFLSSQDNIYSLNNPQSTNNNSLCDQQNTNLIIPSLNLASDSSSFCMRKKMPTDRPLKAKNFEVERFVGNKITNLKFCNRKLPSDFNDESIKKFIRKNSVLGTSRRLQPQFSERFFEPVSTELN